MLILTDNPDYSEHIHPLINRMQPVERISFPENLQPILQVLYPERDIFVGNSETNHGFKYFFLSEHVSFSDRVIISMDFAKEVGAVYQEIYI